MMNKVVYIGLILGVNQCCPTPTEPLTVQWQTHWRSANQRLLTRLVV